ncbi:MAG: hypothetical protein JO119_12735 [Acidobacteria bacterium]|nr:hypothetical protein [Acidobacteriota bacterium]
MRPYKSFLACSVFFGLFLLLPQTLRQPTTVHAEQSTYDTRDGQHDFDYAVGTWKIHLKRLKKRLVGSTEWIELDGTVSCRKVLDGRAEVEEMDVATSDKSMHIQGLAVRLYNPQSHQWSIYWASASDGVMEPNPMVGQFTNGRGEFYNQQIYEGRAVYARFTWTGVTTNSPHFEQAFSVDGGKTWETNWITDQIKEK